MKHALIVDDEPNIRMVLEVMLESVDYTSVEAGDGPEAMRLIEGPIAFDLLVTDYNLPGGMTGLEVAAQARKTNPGLKVLVVTGDRSLIDHIALERGTAFLAKPFGLEEFVSQLEALVR